MGTRLYFEADDGSSGLELWVHETTNDSTWLVADICSGICNGNPSEFTPMGDQIYFQAYDGTSGIELHMMEIEHTITYN
jgi:ELWxxDGT repeat protein